MSSGKVPLRPWVKSYPDNVIWDQRFEPFPVHELLAKTAKKYPHCTHIDFLGRTFSYGDTYQDVCRLASSLQAQGVKKGVHVGIFLPNCPQYIITYFAILKAGGTVVNFSPLYSEPELETQVIDSEVQFMVTLNHVAFYPKMLPLIGVGKLKKLIMCQMEEVLPLFNKVVYRLLGFNKRTRIPKDENHILYSDLMANTRVFSPVEYNPAEDVAVIQYTGGTTGLPKGAMLTHANLSCNLQQAIAWDVDLEEGKGAIISVLPLFHIYALSLAMNVVTALGGSIVLLPRFEIKQFLKTMRRCDIQMLPVVPTLLTAILNASMRRENDFKGIRTCISGGAPLLPDVAERFEGLLNNIKIRQGYGLTETSPLAVAAPPEGAPSRSSTGLPVPGTEIIIVSEDDPSVRMPIGEVGEICIRGQQVMIGYWKRPEESDNVLLDGMLRTGDVGYLDEAGYLYILDRSKDMILVGGMNVYPRIIEEALINHESVKEVTVIGIPDDYSGERPKAFITLEDEWKGKIREEEFIDYLKKLIGKHEIPKYVEFRDQLPKTIIGKLSKKELVEEEKKKYEASKRLIAENKAIG